MNEKRTTYRLLSVLPALLLFSCSQEEMMERGRASDADDIIFHVALPGVETGTRSYDNIQKGDLQGGFSVTAHNLDAPASSDGSIPMYFKEVLVEKTEGMGDMYRSDLCKWPENKNGNEGRLRFYAFYPSLETLKEKSGIFEPGTLDVDNPPKEGYFYLHDISNKNTGLFSYRLGNLKVNRDISRHVDVVTAVANGTKTDNLYSGITLEFSHKLTRIDFKAWSANPSYDIEIAGIRIVGAIVSSTLNMDGSWLYGSATEKKPVEYIFRNGDTLVKLDGSQYNTAATATSIMGNGGWAMIIPGNQNHNVGKYTVWNQTSSSADVYFSVLMRVIDRRPSDNPDVDHMILYPYLDGATITGTTTASNKNSVYLVVDSASEVVKERVYKNKTSKQYFFDSDLKNPYTLAEGLEIREYGWAAIPLKSIQWDAGKEYNYVLNYTYGIGVHAHDDDAAGKAIITPLSVGLSETGGDWEMVKKYEEVLWEEGEDKDFTYIQE